MDSGQKIILPKNLQIKMLNFFVKTSVPRKIKNEKNNKLLSVEDRSDLDCWKQESM